MKIISPEALLNAYASGYFPMAKDKTSPEIVWVEPEMRGIIPLDAFHLSRSMRRFLRKNPFEIRFNENFALTVEKCADREETWINDIIFNSYCFLHSIGHAHSVECWQNGELAGGLYGVSLGSAFFGESMFSTKTNASKTALFFLVKHLKEKNFTLLDTQFLTEHLHSLGAIEIPQKDYLDLLQKALKQKALF